jgi:hypothetical protein
MAARIASGGTEQAIIMAEVVNLLKEIKELLKARNNQLERSSAAPFNNSHALLLAEKLKNDFPSASNIAAETLARDSQCGTPASRPSCDDSARYSSGNPGVEDSVHQDRADRTRYYEMPSLWAECYNFKPFNMPQCRVETREPALTAGPSWNYCEYRAKDCLTLLMYQRQGDLLSWLQRFEIPMGRSIPFPQEEVILITCLNGKSFKWMESGTI